MRRVSDRFYFVADRAERLTRIPVLGRLGWLGMFIYLFMVAVAAVLSGAFLILEWITALAVSAGAFVSRLISRRGFNVQAGLVSYIGAHKPRDGQVRVGPPDKLIVRPVQIVWTCTSLAAAWSTRQLMADHIEAGQFYEIHPAA